MGRTFSSLLMRASMTTVRPRFTASGISRAQLVAPAHHQARGAERLGEPDIVGLAVERGFAVSAVVEDFLPLANHAQHAVVHDDDDNGQAVGHRGRKLVEIHMEAAVAGKEHHAPFGKRALCADGRAMP